MTCNHKITEKIQIRAARGRLFTFLKISVNYYHFFRKKPLSTEVVAQMVRESALHGEGRVFKSWSRQTYDVILFSSAEGLLFTRMSLKQVVTYRSRQQVWISGTSEMTLKRISRLIDVTRLRTIGTQWPWSPNARPSPYEWKDIVTFFRCK